MSIFDFFKNKKKTYSFDELVKYSGGDGSSPENAVIISTIDSSVGVRAEYVYLESKYGRRNVDFQVIRQMLMTINGKDYDVLYIKLADGSQKTIYFHISKLEHI